MQKMERKRRSTMKTSQIAIMVLRFSLKWLCLIGVLSIMYKLKNLINLMKKTAHFSDSVVLFSGMKNKWYMIKACGD